MRELAQRALRDKVYRRRLTVQAGMLIDVLWGAGNLAIGIVQSSVWFITLGAYYLLFGCLRGVILACMDRSGQSVAANPRRIERICGILLLGSIFVLSGIVTLVMKSIGNFVYHEIVIYAMATFAFYSLTVSIVSYVRLRKQDDVLAVTNARVNLAIALVSIFAVEIAMLTAFSTEKDAELNFIMPILTGTAIAITIAFLGVRSIISSGRGTMRDAGD